MMLRKRTNEQLLADIRRRLEQGYTVATAERVKSIASSESDPELLRGMAEALADAIINPKARKPGRPRKLVANEKPGVIDLDALPVMTEKEKAAWIRNWAREGAICEEIRETHAKRGTPIATLCQLHGIGTDTYYKWYPTDS